MSNESTKVWDLGVRLFHWCLVSCVFACYFIIDPRHIHRKIGYVVVALIIFRIIWGFVGGRHARFADFVPSPGTLLGYIRAMFARREARHLGHNPAGGAMIMVLLFTLTAITTSGIMMGMDAFFGVGWVEELHEGAVNGLMILVVMHVSGVIYSSYRHNENLVKSMWTGRKPK